MAEKKSTEKKAYSAPVLKKWGTVADLTKIGSGEQWCFGSLTQRRRHRR